MTRELELDDLINIMGRHAHQILIELKQPSLMPLYHLHGDETLAIGCPWNNENEKLDMLIAIKQQARKINATMIGFVCEAWVTKHAPDADLDSVPKPSQDPNRVEVVMAMATDGDNTKTKSWEIVRNEKDAILRLDPITPAMGMIGGRMIDGLLPRTRKLH